MCACSPCFSLFPFAALSRFFFFFNDTATTEIYTLSLHDALPIWRCRAAAITMTCCCAPDTSARSEEHTSELQSRGLISYAVFCLKKKKKNKMASYTQLKGTTYADTSTRE